MFRKNIFRKRKLPVKPWIQPVPGAHGALVSWRCQKGALSLNEEFSVSKFLDVFGNFSSFFIIFFGEVKTSLACL